MRKDSGKLSSDLHSRNQNDILLHTYLEARIKRDGICTVQPLMLIPDLEVLVTFLILGNTHVHLKA